MFGGKSWEEWVRQYSRSHQHPVNRFCHSIGIPLIVISFPFFIASYFLPGLIWIAAGLFVIGWIFQFVGHAVERTWPEFFHDWRFLFVGLRWWFAKMRGQV